MSSVMQDWYFKMPWKMQSILANGLRAPGPSSSGLFATVRKRSNCAKMIEISMSVIF